ncbi:cadherin-like protein 26 isoform X2 [Ascaphus truei]|uniref:cadherin-like protein 26 isoform X2 n=1 Tax=Ascaphus truei TaxID=8439 RepID=UPI003F5A3202
MYLHLSALYIAEDQVDCTGEQSLLLGSAQHCLKDLSGWDSGRVQNLVRPVSRSSSGLLMHKVYSPRQVGAGVEKDTRLYVLSALQYRLQPAAFLSQSLLSCSLKMRVGYLLFLLLLMVIAAVDARRGGRPADRKAVRKRSARSLNQPESLRPLRRSKRRWVLTTFVLEEEDPGPFPKFAGELFNDRSANMSLKYLISGPGVDEFPEVGLFSVDDRLGHVFVHRKIDREKTALFVVRFDAEDWATGKIVDRTLIFNVEVKDKNDNAPVFDQSEYNITVKESSKLDNPILQVVAIDIDKPETPNSEVVYSMLSQTPELPELTFSIDPKNGLIRGRGCLNYETAKIIKLLVHARDNGAVPLSSTAAVNIHVEDGNNHLPVFTKLKYDLTLPEGELKNDVLRIKVEDKDVAKTPGWRATFKILSGNENGNANITTDPETNDGILSIIKPLDFQKTPEMKLVISVENEEALFSCEQGKLTMNPSPQLSNVALNIIVLDRNDPPLFYPASQIIRQKEGLMPGTVLGKLNATDPDKVPNKIRYKVAHDPAGWVTVDENTGVLTTLKELDRESPFVNNTVYTIIVQAIDDGVPPETGSSTVTIYLSDINDHTPELVSPYVERCEQVQGEAFTIRAVDKDLDPYSGPFKFELADNSENMKDAWRLGQSAGDSVPLLMLKSLPKGNHTVSLNVFDRQGSSGRQTLNVRVCSCPDGLTCEKMQPATHSLGGGAIGVMVAALLLFLLGLCLLMCVFCGSANEKHKGSLPDEGNQTLIKYNEEGGSSLNQAIPAVPPLSPVGNDYVRLNNKEAVIRSPSGTLGRPQHETLERDGVGRSSSGAGHQQHTENRIRDGVGRSPSGAGHQQHTENRIRDGVERSSSGAGRQLHSENWTLGVTSGHAQNERWKRGSGNQSQAENHVHRASGKYMRNESLKKKSLAVFVERVGEMLNHRLQEISNEDERAEHKPHVYAYEGELERIDSVGSFSIPESEADFGFLQELDSKFAKLEEICRK